MNRAFSLVEILTVVAIILVLAAVVWPLILGAKKAGMRATATSHLRQCYVALQLYQESHDLQLLPSAAGAEIALKGVPTTDPADYWRKHGQPAVETPLIGSFAYVRKVATFEPDGAFKAFLNHWESRGQPAPIMLSVFYSSKPLKPAAGFGFAYENPRPDLLLRLRSDGSVATHRSLPDYLISSGWDSLFME